MLRPMPVRSAKWFWPALLAAVVLTPADGPAQKATPKMEGPALPRAHAEGVGKFDRLARGEEKPGPDDKKLLDTFAQYAVYRVTWDAVQAKRGGLAEVARDLEAQVAKLKDPAFLKLFSDRVIACLGEVLSLDPKDNRVSVVGAAMLLPVYAKARDDGFGDYLAKLLTDEKQHLAVRLYAVKALREYFPARAHHPADEPGDKKLQERIARDRGRVQALLTFLGRKWDGTPGVTPEAARFIRREALATLARVDAPAMRAVKGKVDTPAAYALLTVLAPGKAGLRPPPSLSEKCEAAVGVCNLLGAKENKVGMNLIEEYQPDVGVYLVGQFLVEFTKEYIKDYQVFGGKAKEGKVPMLPWKVEATRLEQGLKTLLETTKESPVAPKLAALLKQSTPILEGIRNGRRVDAPTLLQTAVSATRPQTGTVFRGNKELDIDLTGAAGDE